VVVAYGLILPQAVLDAPVHGCLNIHASLLPRWRGAAPIHRAIMAGDSETGVCIMQMEAGLDTGRCSCAARCRSGRGYHRQLHDTLSTLGAKLIVETLRASTPHARTAAGGGRHLCREDRQGGGADRLDRARNVDVDRKIRGLSPFPGAWVMHEGQRIKLLSSALAEGRGAPGEVLDDALTVACGEGAVRLLRLQRAGKGPQDADTFLRGLPIPKGAQL
jgi:methionyl-tRNA formyltransferase